jgi:hypothetical protein
VGEMKDALHSVCAGTPILSRFRNCGGHVFSEANASFSRAGEEVFQIASIPNMGTGCPVHPGDFGPIRTEHATH